MASEADRASCAFYLDSMGRIDALGTRTGSCHWLMPRVAPIHESVASLIPFEVAVTVGAVKSHSDLARFLLNDSQNTAISPVWFATS